MSIPRKLSLKTDEDQARKRLRAFWAGSCIDRPALYVTVPDRSYQPRPWPYPNIDRLARELMPEWHVHQAVESLRSRKWLAEAMPRADIFFGSNLVLLPSLAGGEYLLNNSDTWVKPWPNLWESPLPKFDPAHPIMAALSRCLQAVLDAVGDQVFVNPPVSGVEPMTALSLFREPEQFCLDLIEHPDEVVAWRDALTKIMVAYYEHFYQLLLKNGRTETSSWLQPMAEGRFEAVQSDFSVNISPAMFEEMVLPDLRAHTEYFDYTLYHLDGTCQLRFVDLLSTLQKLNGIQWNPEPGCRPVDWLKAFKHIRAKGLGLLVGTWGEHALADAVELTRQLGPDGLMIVLPPFGTVAEAEDAIRQIERASLKQ